MANKASVSNELKTIHEVVWRMLCMLLVCLFDHVKSVNSHHSGFQLTFEIVLEAYDT